MAKTTGLASVSKKTSEIQYINPRIIKVREGWNSRDFNDPENAQYVEELATNIMEVGGVKEPITVTFERGEVWLDDGECRLKAALLAIKRGFDVKVIPAKPEDRYASEFERLRNQRLRNSAKQFSVFEDAKHFKRMLDVDPTKTLADIAKSCNISTARVSQILEFNTVPNKVKEQVQNGSVSPTLAMQAVKQFGGTEAEKKLSEGIKAAKKEGRTKIKPADIEGGRVNIKTAVKDAFEYADVDDSDDEVIVVKFPAAKWEVLRDILKL